MNEFIIDFQVTKKCNLNCQFCCGADKSKCDVDTETIKKVIDNLALAGVDRIVITGGEPLIRKDIDDIITYIKIKNINIYLSTNGYFLNQHFDTVINNVDCIGLPLDGFYQKTSLGMTRRSDQKKVTLECIEAIKKANPNIIVKVGTVVSKINENELEKLGKLLFESSRTPPDVWRLYQFTPLGVGKINKEKFEISDEDYNKLVFNLKERFKRNSVGSLSNEESNDTYIFIAPDMDIIALTNDDYVRLGNACNMTVEELKMLKKDLSITLKNAQKNRGWTINDK